MANSPKASDHTQRLPFEHGVRIGAFAAAPIRAAGVQSGSGGPVYRDGAQDLRGRAPEGGHGRNYLARYPEPGVPRESGAP